MQGSNILYYQRRHAEELGALRRAVTPEAMDRRAGLVICFADKLKALGVSPAPSPRQPAEAGRRWILDSE